MDADAEIQALRAALAAAEAANAALRAEVERLRAENARLQDPLADLLAGIDIDQLDADIQKIAEAMRHRPNDPAACPCPDCELKRLAADLDEPDEPKIKPPEKPPHLP